MHVEVYPCTDGQSVYGWAVRARVVAPVRAVEPWLSELSELSEKLSELSGTVGHCRTVGTVGTVGPVGPVGLSDHCRTLSDVLFGWSWVGWIAVASMKVAILSVFLVIAVDPFTISIQSHPKINAECVFWIS